jgi:hypothetical protein
MAARPIALDRPGAGCINSTMMELTRSLSVGMAWLGLALGTSIAAEPAGAAPAPKESTRVEATVFFPSTVPSFVNRTLDIRLYGHDPLIMGQAAEVLDQVALSGFSHTQGRETRTNFVIGAKGVLNPKLQYYVTAAVLDEQGRRTHVGQITPGKTDMCKVLTEGNTNKVVLTMRKVR